MTAGRRDLDPVADQHWRPVSSAGVKPKRTCPECGSAKVRHDSKFCSRACYWADRKRKAPTCAVPNCSSPTDARGLCNKHYIRARTTGKTDSLQDRTIPDRFWDKVATGDPEACWPWTGGDRHEFGYGRFHLSNSPQRRIWAHRFAFMLATGEDARGMVVMHSCDNPPCCNPAHLSLGTQRDNVADMIAKGRSDFSGLELGWRRSA